MKRFSKFILPVLTLLCLMAIFLNSAEKSSSLNKKEAAVKDALEGIAQSVTKEDVSIKETGKAVISKSAHVLEYTAFSLLFTASVLTLHGEREGLFSKLMFPCSFVAIADEHLQTLNVNRTARVSDVMIDLAACFIGFALAYLIFKWLERRKKNAPSSSDT